jgi:hypothetical protein
VSTVVVAAVANRFVRWLYHWLRRCVALNLPSYLQATSGIGAIKSENRNLAAMACGNRRRACFCRR